MKKIIASLLLIVSMSYCRSLKRELTPKQIIAKYSFGGEGSVSGEFYSPNKLAIKEDYIFVADAGNNRIQVLEIKY